MTADSQTCPSCGAHVPPEADRCDLCGTPVGGSAADSDAPDDESVDPDASTAESETAESESSPDAASASSGAADGPTVFCNQCGWENPPGARYCSRCGERLQDLSDAPASGTSDAASDDTSDAAPAGTRPVSADLPRSPAAEASTDTESTDVPDEQEADEQGTDEQAAMGRQITLVVGGALVLVLGLFFMTQWSAQYEWGGDSGSSASSAQAGAESGGSPSARSSGGQRPMGTPGQGETGQEPADLQALLDQTADSLTGSVAAQIDSLRTRIGRASGTERRRLQTELVNLFVGAGHPGRAAVVQQDLAETTGSVDAQRRAADLLYRWMQKLQGQGQREQVLQVARHAAQAYESVAEQRPDDLDARTRMGEAYLLTNEPMQGIKAINGVLDEDSTFVPARFQKGLALLQINRLDQAMRQFEMVKQYAEDGSPFYQQADRALTVIEEQRNPSSSGGAAPAPGSDR